MTERFSTGVLLFPGFETLDVMGPLEMFGWRENPFDLVMAAQTPDPVASAQGQRICIDATIDDPRQYDILLVPGGRGTRTEVDNTELTGWIARQAAGATYVTSVCTGTALLARAGIIDGIRATSNKNAFQWVMEQGPGVEWVYHARWVRDGRFYTSSGVSAGMDMSLALIADLCGDAVAERTAQGTEYIWNRDPGQDPFARDPALSGTGKS